VAQVSKRLDPTFFYSEQAASKDSKAFPLYLKIIHTNIGQKEMFP